MDDVTAARLPLEPAASFPHGLVPTTAIAGSVVYDRDGGRLGTISALIADNRSGQIRFAVIASGGFLGVGESQHPLPWSRLEHDTRRGGYILGIDAALLRSGPSYSAGDAPAFADAEAERIAGYYSSPGTPGS